VSGDPSQIEDARHLRLTGLGQAEPPGKHRYPFVGGGHDRGEATVTRPHDGPPPDGLVLAGGSGRRLGQPKAGVLLEGRTLMERAIAMLNARCARVVVVSRTGVPLPPLDQIVILDAPGPSGPMNALATGFGVLDAEDVVVLACDLPLAAPLLDRLIETPGHAAAVASDGSRLQPLCARYPRAATLQATRTLMEGGVFRMTELVAALDAVAVMATGPELLNVNRSEDLEQAARLLPDVTKPSGSVREP
jgi:molybdenum cofactor guanylyltransferase